MGILEGKRILITGVLTDASLAYATAELAIFEGAQIVLTGAGRGLSMTQRMGRKLSSEVEVFELDVTQPDHFTALTTALTALELLVAFLQAYVFAVLTCVYLSDAVHGAH